MTHAVYANPANVALADQLAASLEPPARVTLSEEVDERAIFVVDDDAPRHGSNLYLASKAMCLIESAGAD